MTPLDFYSGSNGYQPEHDSAQYYCREQRCPNCTTSQSSNCAKQHWRFLVELTNGKFVFLRAHYLTDVKSDGWVAMNIADNPADLIAAMTSAEYANYTTFTIAELATYCQLG